MAICLVAGIAVVATAQQATQKAPEKKEVKASTVAEKPKLAAAVTAGPKKADGTPHKVLMLIKRTKNART